MSWLHLTAEITQSLSKDAREVTADPDGRWFAFRIGVESLLVVEKKTIPDHLGSCDFLDKPTTVNDILTELQDAGEESELIICNSFEVMFLVNVSWSLLLILFKLPLTCFTDFGFTHCSSAF